MCKKLNYLLVLILTMGMTGCVTTKGADPGASNLKHSWTFNDGTAKDDVGSADGTLMGGAVIEDGMLITSFSMQWMEMPAGTIALNKYKEVTIEAWFISSAGENTEFHMLAYFGDIVHGQGSNGYFITPARGDDTSRAAISCGVTTDPWTGESGVNGPEYDDGKLHHMVSTLNDKEITLYIDGELIAGTPLASTNGIACISPKFAYLAKGGYEADPYWNGKILEFNIYDRALTAKEIHFLSLKDHSSAVD